MLLNADILLALRYLRPKRTFISFVTLLSVLGPVLGVGLLVIVIAVMSGFDRQLKQGILSMQSHVQVTPSARNSEDSVAVLSNPERIVSRLQALDCEAAPIVEGPVLLQVRNQAAGKFVRGILPEQERQVTDFADKVRGRFDVEEGEAVIGAQLAAELGIQLGDNLLIHSPANLTANFVWDESGQIQSRDQAEVYLPEEVEVVGILSMGIYEYDSTLVILHLDQAADLFGLPWGAATTIHAKVPNPFRVTPIVETLQEDFPFLRIVTWQEANKQYFDALRVEKNMMFFLLTFIVLVAAFGISTTLVTVAVQKTREIGVLKAVGFGPLDVARIFLYQGAIIGAIGTSLGVSAGLLVLHYRSAIAAFLARFLGVEIFPPELYHFTEIPARVLPTDVAVIAVSALLLCMLAALVPAGYASLLSPADALREDNL